jgi:hypothetical protein
VKIATLLSSKGAPVSALIYYFFGDSEPTLFSILRARGRLTSIDLSLKVDD